MKKTTIFSVFITLTVFANPKPEMDLALRALENLLPFIAREERFKEAKNEADISDSLTQLEKTFGSIRHDKLLQNDLFAPSYQMIRENISEALRAFKDGNKDYAHWRMTEITNQCLDCHTRIPENYPSKFQKKKLTLNPKKFATPFDLGTAQFIVRDYAAAEKTFLSVIDADLSSKKFLDTEDAFRNVLTINTKVKPDFAKMHTLVQKYLKDKTLAMDIQEELRDWEVALRKIEKARSFSAPLETDRDVRGLIADYLEPVKTKDGTFLGTYDVYLLASSGLLSRYLFTHRDSPLAPEITYWIGWCEKVLKRDNFFSSGDLFFKQCIRRYPKSAIAPQCLSEWKDSMQFLFSGSGGVHFPSEFHKELKEFEGLMKSP